MTRALGVPIVLVLLAAPAVAVPKTVDALARDLAEMDPGIRARACVELRERWPDGARAIPVLVDAVTDDDPGVAKAAKATLQRFGAKGLEVYGNFLRHGRDAERKHFIRIVEAVEITRSRPQAYCPVICDHRLDTAARRAATFAVALAPGRSDDAGPAMDLLVDIIGNRDAGIREAAAASLAIRTGYAPPGPRDLLRGQPDGIRIAALCLLGQIDDGGTTKLLVDALGDDSRPVRLAALDALGRAGSHGIIAETVLARLAAKNDLDSRDAGRALGRLGLTKPLVSLLAAGDEETRIRAAIALSWAGSDGVAGVPVLSEWFLVSPARLGYMATHVEITEALARIGRAAAKAGSGAVSSLEQALVYGDDPSIPVAAAAALCRIAPPSEKTLAVLKAAFRPPPGKRIRALDARVALRGVIQLGPAAKPLVTPLCEVLRIRANPRKPDWPAPGEFGVAWLARRDNVGRLRRMKRLALDALAAIGKDAGAARKVLVWILGKHEDPIIRYRAARALRRIGE